MQLDACPPIRYLKRRGQRNIRIRVKHDAITVSAPWYCSNREMAHFVAEREAWIRQAFDRLHTAEAGKRAELEAHRGHLLLRGIWVPVVLREARPDSDQWLLTERAGRIDAYPPEGVESSAFAVASAIDDLGKTRLLADVPDTVRRDFARRLASAELPVEFEQIANQLGFSWNRLFIRSQKTKWGTCSAKGHISLNWRLIKCPETIRHYIIIHELCHTIHLNHSDAFWTLVRSYYPEVDRAHRWLKSEGSLAFL